MISMQALSLIRGNKMLCSHFSALFSAGKVVVILGPNGAGKSTLLQAIMGMFKAEHGCVLLNQRDVLQMSRREIADLVAWQGELPPSEFGLTVVQRLHLSASPPSAEGLQQAMDRMELSALQHRALGALSSGERQRVEIAAMMLRDQPIWLLDEPTAHLDLKHQADCLAVMRHAAAAGRCVITVLHDLQQAASVADILVVLDGQGGICSGDALQMLTAEQLQPVFGVKLEGTGKSLRPIYEGE